MQRCSKCLLPESYETIEFGTDGICNICKAKEGEEARTKGDSVLFDLRSRSGNYDCIVPFSGGKDSTYTLWYVVKVLGLRPLAVQFNHGFLRGGLLRNNERTIRRLGCDFHSFTGNWHLVRRVMLEAFIRKTDFCWHCHSAIFAYPVQVALKEKVSLLIWGERSTEYTAYYGKDEEEEVDEKRFNRFVNLGITAEDMANMIKHDTNFDCRDFAPYTYPKLEDLKALGVRSVCLGSYIPWDTKKQSEIIQRELGWVGDEVEGMPAGQWPYEKIECGMQGMRDYVKFLKRGYSRVSQMCALDLRNGRMNKEDALDFISKEGKRPASFPIFLDYLGITESEFYEHVQRSVVYPNEMDLTRGESPPVHDMAQWWREK